MDRENIISLIEEILSNELELGIKDLEPQKTLLELGIDSISLMTLIVYIEEKLSIEIDLAGDLSAEYSKITMDALVKCISEKLEKAK